MIERLFDAARLNEIINDPSVYPWVKGNANGPLDLTDAVDDRRNILLMGEHGGIIFTELQQGLYECHTQVLPEGRGQWAVDMAKACLHWMFTRTLCMEVMTKCPKGNPAARALASVVGFHHEFTARNGWVLDGKSVDASIFTLRIHDWVLRCDALLERGRWFCDRLNREFVRLDVAEEALADDIEHDRFVGMAYEMILGKQVQKGVILYNRWAMMAGYKPVSVVSLNPTSLDIGNALVVVRDNGDVYVGAVKRQGKQ